MGGVKISPGAKADSIAREVVFVVRRVNRHAESFFHGAFETLRELFARRALLTRGFRQAQ